MKAAPAHGQARLALGALLIANVALACGPWLVRLAQSDAHVGPIASGFWRLALALPVLLFAMTRAGEPPLPRRGPLLPIVGLGGLLFAADLAAWHIGILHTRLANATLLGNSPAILFPLYGFIVARRWPRPRQGLALLLALAGALLLLGRSYEMSARNLTGDLLCILAGLLYTGYLVAIDRARRQMGPVGTLTISVAAGIPVLLAAVLLAGDPLWPRDWTPLILLAFGSQLIGQGLILWSVGRLAPLIVGLMLLSQPIVAAVIGWLAYGERLQAADAIGALAIAAAVLLVRGGGPRPLPPAGSALISPP